VSLALVTGASGFIGSHVATDLLAHGWRVRALVRPEGMPARRWPAGAEAVPGDLRDPGALEYAARGCEAVFHVGAHYALRRGAAAELERSNVEGTANALAAAGATGARFVHTSSVSTIGLPAGGGVGDEETPFDPALAVGAYKRSKVAAEALVRRAAAAGQWAAIVNPSAPVGPGDWKPTPTGRVILDFLRRRMPAYVDTGLNLIDVRDVAAGHRLALERGRSGRRYILGHENLTLIEILRALSDITGLPAPRVRLPHAAAIGIAAVSELVEGRLLRREPLAPLDGARMARKRMFYSPARAVAELGLPQSPVRAALADAVEWYYAAGMARRAGLGRPVRA
jgi:dihydroflavonol-4-reductase